MLVTVATRCETRQAPEAGFTLVELLAVMLILGILAAIALPAFFSQKEKSADARAKVYAHTAQVAIVTYSTDQEDSYVGADEEALEAIDPTLSNAILTVEEATKDKYKILSESTNGHRFYVAEDEGRMSYTCAPPEQGGCPAGGVWGE